jgi:hypothetical protein
LREIFIKIYFKKIKFGGRNTDATGGRIQAEVAVYSPGAQAN